ncbi:TlpA family protein disulfide reductase [Dechloromonas denitrificans]|uniref:TlpA family protein disulfide reductase n=1 Tax=Dechloromonas denitrificans TaxID=281362 RepID=UPI001CF86C8A|nr:TlpA disulfide reductase family protein [Dechloromonas denitrificans]UCV10704.1 TlpA family protein disulfide reductase [Dechloromonas denitrificans]
MTSRLRNSLALGIALITGPLAMAAVDHQESTKTALDFELADNRQFIQLSTLTAQTTVINFWRADCPPCLREMPLLAQLARSGKARVITIALQRPAETAAAPATILDALTPPVLALHGPQNPRGLLARFGNPRGAIPHTVVLNAERRTCGQFTGEITPYWLNTMLARCSSS